MGARCGSFASSALPEVVCLPSTTQEFEPMPLPFGPRSAGISSRVSERAAIWVFRPSVAPSGVDDPMVSDGVASGSNFPVTGEIAPCSTIGLCCLYG